MTKMIEFTRQLWPQPPKGARPWFCYSDTLIFHNEELNEVWRQKIPECLIKWDPKPGASSPLNVRVEWDEHWGWLLRFYITHDDAIELWGHYLKRKWPMNRSPEWRGHFLQPNLLMPGLARQMKVIGGSP